ncbi:HNH endonuclease, partial [Halomonas sp. SIMBA_159]
LVSVNIATFGAFEDGNPFAEAEGNPWERIGWCVKAKYLELSHPVSMREHIEDILSHCPPKYSPFTRTGGGTQGYLFEIDQAFGEYFLSLVMRNNNLLINESNEKEVAEIEDIEKLIDQTTTNTEKERIIKTRIGQGLFKQKLLNRSPECEICGLDVPSLLIASHCKPWSESDNFERLDDNNGLLLCANHDGVFDRGLISFYSNGEIII